MTASPGAKTTENYGLIMKGDAKPLYKLLDGSDRKLFIPVYQRNYDWKRDNCEQLFRDLGKLINSDRRSHFFGSIVTAHLHGGDQDSLVIIDGQQRITTVSLLLLAMVNAVKDGDANADSPSVCDKIMTSCIIDEYSTDSTKVRLKSASGDSEAFLKIVGNEKDSFIESSNITVNYRFLYDLVKGMEWSVDKLFEAVRKLEIINIFVEDDDDPQLIFESLNSTGLKLTKADMIRNFVLMGLEPKKQEDYYRKYWVKIEENTQRSRTADFFRDFLTVRQGSIPSIDSVYSEFKKYAEDRDTEEVLKDLLGMSKIYSKILSPGQYGEEVNGILSRFNILEMTVAYPYLMSLLSYFDEGSMDEDDLVRVLGCIETFVFRRQICGYPTASLNKIFCTLHGEALKAMNSANSYASSVIYVLLSKTRSSVFPRDAEYSKEFVTKDIYSMQKKNRLYLFDRLENQKSRETNDVIGKIRSHVYTIEHIMPQTLSEDWKKDLGENWQHVYDTWLNTIANLTLTGYNSRYLNKRFIEKKDAENGFSDSSLRLNKFLQKCDKWTETELQKRSDLLLELALNLWPYPKTDYKPVERAENEHSLGEDFDFTHSAPKKFILCGTEYPCRDWTSLLETVLRTLNDRDSTVMSGMPERLQSALVCRKPLVKGRWIPIAEFFVNVNTDTMSKIRLLREVLDEYELEHSELGIILSGSRGNGQTDDTDSELQSGRRELFFEFWTEFQRSFDADPVGGLRHGKAHHRNWQDLYTGLSGFHYLLRTAQGGCSVLGYFTRDMAKEHYERIKELCQNRIVETFGADAVEWNCAEEQKSCYISVSAADMEISNRENWPAMISWLRGTLSKLSSIISPYYGELKGTKE